MDSLKISSGNINRVHPSITKLETIFPWVSIQVANILTCIKGLEGCSESFFHGYFSCKTRKVTRYRSKSISNTAYSVPKTTSTSVSMTRTRTVYDKVLTSRWIPPGSNGSGGYYVQDEQLIPRTETQSGYTMYTQVDEWEAYLTEELDYSTGEMKYPPACKCWYCQSLKWSGNSIF